jgi:hypothetical protein
MGWFSFYFPLHRGEPEARMLEATAPGIYSSKNVRWSIAAITPQMLDKSKRLAAVGEET